MKKRLIVALVILGVSIGLNAAAWYVPGFSDWFTDRILPYWGRTLGRFNSLFSFSVGELLIFAGIILIVVLLSMTVLCLFLHRRKRFTAAAGRLWLKTLGIVILVYAVETSNCLIEYHCTPLEQGLPGYGQSYDTDDIARLRDYIVNEVNTRAGQLPRDSHGEILYVGGENAMQQTARSAIASLSDAYPRLRGSSVVPKPLTASRFVSQQYMQGYYFPFSMEACYNTLMKDMNKPFTMCHELSHTHGYIYEDDANFLGFLACVRSGDPVFEYSGWLGVLNYVNNDFYQAVSRETYESHPAISETVQRDSEFLSDEAWQDVESHKLFRTETVRAAADTAVDTTLKVNGVSSGKESYSRVVRLLLEYFNGEYQLPAAG